MRLDWKHIVGVAIGAVLALVSSTYVPGLKESVCNPMGVAAPQAVQVK